MLFPIMPAAKFIPCGFYILFHLFYVTTSPETGSRNRLLSLQWFLCAADIPGTLDTVTAHVCIYRRIII